MTLGFACAGCHTFRFQAGLANVPSLNRPWTSEDFAHDVIANGDESCPRSGRPEDDRLSRRWPPCGGALTPTRRIAPPTPPRAGPVRDPDILSGAEP